MRYAKYANIMKNHVSGTIRQSPPTLNLPLRLPLHREQHIWKHFGPNASLDEIREVASRLCRDYLTGRWKVVSADQLTVKRISGGLSNFLYYVSLPDADVDDDFSLGADAVVSGNGNSEKRASVPDTACGGRSVLLAVGETDKNKNSCDGDALLGATGASSNVNINNVNKRQRTESGASCENVKYLLQQTNQEPHEVLLRVYGQTHGEDALESMISESVVFALLSERNFGPKLHGIFPGGRIEQYIPARALRTTELSDPRISMKIAEKMGEIHSLNIPMSKEPDWVWSCMERWLKSIGSILDRTDWKEKGHEAHLQIVRGFDFYEEAKWLKMIIDQGRYTVLFCHNDLQEGNILLREVDERSDTEDSFEEIEELQRKRTKGNDHLSDLDSSLDSASSIRSAANSEPNLIIIDFEYCAYNYRGFDLANHFLEWTFDYTNPEFPHFYHHKHQYPSRQQRHDFIATYLKKLNENVDNYEPSTEEILGVEEEIRVFSMFSHLFWSLWSTVNVTSNIEFGYWEYGVTRIQEFQLLKQEFINNNNNNNNNNGDAEKAMILG